MSDNWRGRGGHRGGDRGGSHGGGNWKPPGGGYQGQRGGGGGNYQRGVGGHGSGQGAPRGGAARGTGDGSCGGGGGGVFRGPQMDVKLKPANLPEDITPKMLQVAPLGFSNATLQPPPGCEPGTVQDREIGLIVNHVPSKIKLPETIYQYEVAVDMDEESKKVKQERKKKKPQDPKAGQRRGPVSHTDPSSDDAPRPRLWKKIVKHIIPLLEKWNDECSSPAPSTSSASGQSAPAPRTGGSNIKQSKRKGKAALAPKPEPEKPSFSVSTPRGGIKFATDGLKQIYTATPIAKNEYKGTYGLITIKWNADQDVYEIVVPLAVLEEEDPNAVDVYVVRVKLVDEIPTGVLQPYVADILSWVRAHDGQLPAIEEKLSAIYNIVLKTVPLFRFVPVGRASFFQMPPPGEDGYPLGGGLVNWSGHSLIFNFGWKPFVNIDVANSAFLLGRSVMDVLDDLCFETFWNAQTRQEERRRLRINNVEVNPRNFASFGGDVLRRANNLLRTCKILYKYGTGDQYTKRVMEVVNVRPEQHTFTSRDGGDTNVEAYCRSKRTILRERNGVCLKLNGNNIVPAEICEVLKGQNFSQKLDEAQTANMIKDTAKDPAVRLQKIEEALKLDDHSNDLVLREFGVTVEDKLLKIDKARVLPPPTLVYGSNQPNMQAHVVPGREGLWAMNQSMRFFTPARKVNWGIIQIGNRQLQEQDLRKFVGELIQSGRNAGMDLGSAEEVIRSMGLLRSERNREFKTDLYSDFEYFQTHQFKMVVVIIPRKDTNIYSTVKQTSELFLRNGILTQCVVEKNVTKCQPATIDNLILKINSKLGGVNYLMLENRGYERINILKAPVIIVGADVTHPPPGSKIPSMAAVTASFDRTGMPFMMHTQAQRNPEAGAAEIIEGLDDIMKKMLRTFIDKSGYKPRKIIFYRDGVGDSQFGEVLQREMMQIRAACAALDNIVGRNDLPVPKEKYEPKITFIAVQKRHKTRFFAANPADGVGKPKNAPPGTVVDTQIVSPNRKDFFLLSHLGIQGTSRPTRYQVIWDDSDFNMDELQLLTFSLCFTYCRCTRSVSYPAPTYYAHLAATRAKIHIHNMSDEQMQNIEMVNQTITRQPQMITEFPMHFV